MTTWSCFLNLKKVQEIPVASMNLKKEVKDLKRMNGRIYINLLMMLGSTEDKTDKFILHLKMKV
jgi:hypothetical protein